MYLRICNVLDKQQTTTTTTWSVERVPWQHGASVNMAQTQLPSVGRPVATQHTLTHPLRRLPLLPPPPHHLPPPDKHTSTSSPCTLISLTR